MLCVRLLFGEELVSVLLPDENDRHEGIEALRTATPLFVAVTTVETSCCESDNHRGTA